jgi:SAM-dependent methyltransferase
VQLRGEDPDARCRGGGCSSDDAPMVQPHTLTTDGGLDMSERNISAPFDPPDNAGTAEHWDAIYAARPTTALSWYESEPTVSLRLIEAAGVNPSRGVVDIGGGASSLVDRLLDRGYERVTLVDASRRALDDVAARLGDRAVRVTFVRGSVLDWQPEHSYGVWHDRAVFHFLRAPEDRRRYVALAAESVTPGGVVILGAFAPDGPTECSGLPVARYDADGLARVFGPAFELEHSERDEHSTPGGALQPFTWVILRRRHPSSAQQVAR